MILTKPRLPSLMMILVVLGMLVTEADALGQAQVLTSAVLKVCYDGTLFHGWSASNHRNIDNLSHLKSDVVDGPGTQRRTRSRRNKLRPSVRPGEVRSVEQCLKIALAKLYGNVPLNKIVVEGSSRTDKGVHSDSSYALVYCIGCDSGPFSIKGKRLPHPTSPFDEAFQELPFHSDLHKLILTLNKMLPPDVRVKNISPMPILHTGEYKPFHPSLDSVQKTYRYTFSVGDIHDPIRCRNVWHVPHRSVIDMGRAEKCAEILCGKHDFLAFRGAFRGNERGKKQDDTVCEIFDISIVDEVDLISQGLNFGVSNLTRTFCIDITGDRFLYKQVRFMVGAILQISTDDHIPEDSLKLILERKEWPEKSQMSFPRLCAPSHGLCLIDVMFDPKWKFEWLLEELREEYRRGDDCS